MAKGSNQESSMWSIKDTDDRPFVSILEQKTFIRQHFADSFRPPLHEPENLTGCIENFLGQEILDLPLTRNLKLKGTAA